ncbi:MAG: nitroreductase family protein [Candidatus Margulisiibacteriota bacterium]
MDFLGLSRTRQSCRRYSDKQVKREDLEYCLEAARLAPSACNSQPWTFIVVTEKTKKAELSEGAFHGIYSMNTFASCAPVLIAVIREKGSGTSRIGAMFKGTDYPLIDIGIACEHLVLAAAEKGLGTCYLGWFDEKRAKKVLGLAKNKKVDLIISLGYPEDSVLREKMRKDMNDIAEIR